MELNSYCKSSSWKQIVAHEVLSFENYRSKRIHNENISHNILKCTWEVIVCQTAGFLILLHVHIRAQFSFWTNPTHIHTYRPPHTGRLRTVNKMQTYQSRTFITKIKSFQAWLPLHVPAASSFLISLPRLPSFSWRRPASQAKSLSFA